MAVTKPDTLLAIAPINSNTHVNNDSGNHTQAPAALAKPRQKEIMSKYVRYATTALLNREPKIGSQISQMNKMT